MYLHSRLALVSICIPTYNSLTYIQETVESILSQKYLNIELLIQDNQSTDGTWEYLVLLAKQYPQILIEQNKQNIGATGNFNQVVNRAKGQYVVFIGSDDVLDPLFVSKCIHVFENMPYLDLVTTNYHYREENRRWQKKLRLSAGLHQNFVGSVVIANCFSTNCTMFKSSAIEQLRINGYPFQTSLYTFDLDLWYRVALSGMKVFYIDEALCDIRVHSNSTSQRYSLKIFKHIFLTTIYHRKSIKHLAPTAYKLKMLRFVFRHIGHLLSGQSKDWRLLKAITGELLRGKNQPRKA